MSALPRTLNDLKEVLCLGVAGNFAGHLEQAGETPDFVNVTTQEAKAPKGLFPYYIPHHPGILGCFPLSASEIIYPKSLAENAHLQAEPEVCVLFDVTYQAHQVTELTPCAFAVFNDCSIRKPGAKKISDKKNWGVATKGVSKTFMPLSHFEAGCELDVMHIASFLKRDGQFHAYGKDSSVLTYSYFHGQLKAWMIHQLNEQTDFGPLENLSDIIQAANQPSQMMVSLGATTYTEYGETVFLAPGDEIFFCAYDSTQHSAEAVFQHLCESDQHTTECLPGSSTLHQKIV
ncbi:MAG: hypothetical protein GXO35_06585 [Gammaproteobacteria bacterium]|nr:hypothetical protein [Gammaproteobacteria bacterium]